MHRCLKVSEILNRVADGLQRADAYRFALACKTFLEPGLDEVWREIRSFDPLIACLPDLWSEEASSTQRRPVVVLELRRDLTCEDLRRYLTYYAPRIRKISFGWSGKRIPSVEGFRALELVTDFQPGALSPRLKEFQWFNAVLAYHYFEKAHSKFLASSMFLFLGGSVEILKVTTAHGVADSILHKASINLSIKRLATNLKQLTVFGEKDIRHCFDSLSWPSLQAVLMTDAPISSIPRLATLPCLERLEINGFDDDLPPPQPPTSHGFSTLRTLSIFSDSPLDLEHILQYLPPSNVIEEVISDDWDLDFSRHELQDALVVLRKHCNPVTLTYLALSTDLARHRESIEPDEPDEIDLSPLYPFEKLQYLSLNFSRKVFICPNIVTKIPTMWPQLQTLVLCPTYCSSHIPLINHEDIVRLADSLPSLRELGLQFDATRIPDAQQHIPRRASKLRTLYVGVSPIYSPSRAVVFLERNFPFLEKLDTTYGNESEVGTLYIERWKVVSEQWALES